MNALSRVRIPGGLTLRTRINLIIGGLVLVVVGTLTMIDLENTRSSVREEIMASHRVAIQLVTEATERHADSGLGTVVAFLSRIGRVRSNEIALYDSAGNKLYQSPVSGYKQGREAPRWYALMVATPLAPFEVTLKGGRLVIKPNASRAVLDGWDDMKAQMLGALTLLLAVNVLVFYSVGRCLAPLEKIRQALEQMGEGDYRVRLPALAGAEAAAIGETVNRMGAAIEKSREAGVQAAQAQAQLAAERRFVQDMNRRIEEERRVLAAELHDELGQSVTAVRSLAHALVQRCGPGNAAVVQTGDLLLRTTDMMYEAMHRMIPRLRPPALDRLGLFDAIGDLLQSLRIQQPAIRFEAQLAPADVHVAALDEPLQIGAYRIVQEALNNAIRHAHADHIRVTLAHTGTQLALSVDDNGIGMDAPGPVAGRFGLYGMIERASMLGGHLAVDRATLGGLSVSAALPVSASLQGQPAVMPPKPTIQVTAP